MLNLPLMAKPFEPRANTSIQFICSRCYDVITGTVLWQCNVGEKQNEISALKPLLTASLVKGRIFSLDALHTQRLLCAQVHRLQGEYMLVAHVQPTDAQRRYRRFVCATALLIGTDGSKPRRGTRGHGRLEHRQIISSPDLNDWFGKDWEGIEQVFRLERTVRTLKTGELHHEVVYGLSSLSLRQAPPARMLGLVRKHWAIENRLRLPSRCDLRGRCLPNTYWGHSQLVSSAQ